MDRPSVTLADIEAARRRCAAIVRDTPLWPSIALTERLGVPVVLKCENMQRTGSFKIRGATNMIALRSDGAAGIVAASAGNHAQGVALAASEAGLPATVFMPSTAPLAKQQATTAYGAAIELVDGPLSECQERAIARADDQGLLYVPPYDATEVVAGQGTLGLEVAEGCAELDTVLVPAGGGGLLAGVAVAVKALHPRARVIGVQSAAMPGIVESRRIGSARAVEAVQTIADGAAVAGPSPLTFELIERYVADVITVSEEAIARAIVLTLERARLVVEGAGALGVAAILDEQVTAEGVTAVVLSGGNIDINVMGRLIDRGLMQTGRLERVSVASANVPGELARISAAAAQAGANILAVDHQSVTPDLPVGVARIVLTLELSGVKGRRYLEESLLAAGFARGDLTDFVTPAVGQRGPRDVDPETT